MFEDPKDLARYAQELLRLSYTPNLNPMQLKAIELGAATLCNHVWDWHLELHGTAYRQAKKAAYVAACQPPPTDKALTAWFKWEFGIAHPEWVPLNKISNATKHAKEMLSNPENVTHSFIKFEHYDWWSATHEVETLQVEVDGKDRSVSALVSMFARRYIEEDQPAPSGLPEPPNWS